MSTPALDILQQPARPGGPHSPTDPDLAYDQAVRSLPTLQTLRRRSLLRLGLLGALLVIVLMPNVPLLAPLGSLALLGAIFGVSAWDRYLGKQLAEGLARAEELGLLGRFPESWDTAWRTLPLCRKHPLGQESWLRLTLTMGRAAMWGRAYETAETLVALVSQQIGPDHPLASFCHVQRSLAAAFDGRPGVAEDELVAVRGTLRRSPSPQAGAVLLVAELAQAYAAQQPARAIEHLEDREERLAPLGRDAGIGHLLAAWAYQQVGQGESARAAYRDAVLLLGVDACQAVLDLEIEPDSGSPAAGEASDG
jgi:hypothetical protein